jgi:hypothetical protein
VAGRGRVRGILGILLALRIHDEDAIAASPQPSSADVTINKPASATAR